jgi:hypothetical protein
MHSLKDKFDEVCLRVRDGRRLESTGSAPIYYLVFPVKQILEVKRQTKAWTAKLENLGWKVVTFSFAEAIDSIFKNHKLRGSWVTGEKMLLSKAQGAIPGATMSQINTTLAKALTEGPELLTLIRQKWQRHPAILMGYFSSQISKRFIPICGSTASRQKSRMKSAVQ